MDKGATHKQKDNNPNKVVAFRRRKSITWGEIAVAATSISPEMEQSHFSPDSEIQTSTDEPTTTVGSSQGEPS